MSSLATDQLNRALDRISQREKAVGAFAFLAEDSARNRAAVLDGLKEPERRSLPLFGVPVAIKDIIHVAGMPTSAGSPILRGFQPTEDAECVQKLRRAGAVIVGKTVTTEFAFSAPAATRNPRNIGHSPGGSSSGSAAAVAAGFCSAALGTQTFGSVIRPAAYCGVIGFKPTYGAISRDGVIPLSWSFDHVGIFSQTVESAARVADVLLGEKYRYERPCRIAEKSGSNEKKQMGDIVIGIPDRYFTEGVDATVREGYEAGLETLQRAGARIAAVQLPPLFESAMAAAGIILRAEAATFHRKWFPERAADYSVELRAAIESGNSISAVEYLQARQIRREAQRQMQDLWNRVAFLATPSAPTTAPEGIGSTGNPIFNIPFSVFGNPVITLPSNYSKQGLPAGFQIGAPRWSETKLLRLALMLERAGFGRVMSHEETCNMSAT